MSCRQLVAALLLLTSIYSSAGVQNAPASVRTMAYSDLATAMNKSVPATVISLNDATISAEISASIIEIRRRVGDIVEKNSVLAKLECDDYRIAHRQKLAVQKRLKSQNILAEQRLKRARQLGHTNNISVEQLDQRKAEFDALLAEKEEQEAVMELALRMITKCSIRAPFSGVVTQRQAQAGAITMPDQPMFQLVDTDNVEISARIRPTFLNDLESAKTIEFEFDGTYFPLSLRAIVHAVDFRSRDQEVRLTFTGSKALPGLRGRMRWKSSKRVLPARLFVRRDNQIGIFIVQEGFARFSPTHNALVGRNSTVSLPSHTTIIIKGHIGLQDGDPVIVISE